MHEELSKQIEGFGFISAEAFLQWQFTRYLLDKVVELEAEISLYEDKYACNYQEFEKRFNAEHEEVFEEWDDSILWEFLELELQDAHKALVKLDETGLLIHEEEEIKTSPSNGLYEYHVELEQKHESESKNDEHPE